MESLNKLQRIIFGYRINVFSYHKNLVYAATLSESQRVIWLQFIIEEFGPNIQNISGVYNIVSDALGIFLYVPVYNCKLRTEKDKCRVNN